MTDAFAGYWFQADVSGRGSGVRMTRPVRETLPPALKRKLTDLSSDARGIVFTAAKRFFSVSQRTSLPSAAFSAARCQPEEPENGTASDLPSAPAKTASKDELVSASSNVQRTSNALPAGSALSLRKSIVSRVTAPPTEPRRLWIGSFETDSSSVTAVPGAWSR